MARRKSAPFTIDRKFETVKDRVVTTSRSLYRKTTAFIKKRPLGSLVIAFLLLFLVLFAGQVLGKSADKEKKMTQSKLIRVYSIGDAPKATFQAKIEKKGVVKITAQSAGIVQYLSVREGDEVGRGQQLLSLASNYQGGNAPSIQRQIAGEQYQNVIDTEGAQKDGINKQRDIASKTDENSDRTREISRQSRDDTNTQIDAAQDQVDQLSSTIDQLKVSNPQGVDVGALEAQLSQAKSGVAQLQSSQRTLDYQQSNDNPPAKLADLQKDLSMKQLDIQDRTLQMTREVSRLQVSLAYVSEAMMAPASPFAGKVERLYVSEGESVSPGDVLAVVSGVETKATAVLQVPESIARIISRGEPSELIINNAKVAVTPYYVSSEATDGNLYTVFYDIPAGNQKDLADGDYLSISVPVDSAKTSSVDPFVPVDAVYQTQDEAYVLIMRGGKAESRRIQLGEVYGSSVQVVSGLKFGDQIILDRNVISGDNVKIN